MLKIKTILKLLFVSLIVILAFVILNVNMNLNRKSISSLTLANIEALAISEGESGADCKGRFYKKWNFSGSNYGLANANKEESCSLPCPNVTTNGVYGETYKCVK